MSLPMRTAAILAGLACVPSGLSAQESRWSASVNAIRALDALEKITAAPAGLSLGVSCDMKLVQTDVPFRAGVHFNVLPGKEAGTGLKTSLSSIQLTGDVLLATPVKGLRCLTGFSLSRYRVSNSGTPLQDPGGKILTYWPAEPDSGLKMGFRFGLEQALTKCLSLEVLYQVTELGATPAAVAEHGSVPSAVKGTTNPAWLEIGARLRF